MGSIAIRGVLDRVQIKNEEVQEVFFGQVLQAGGGQAPARQAALHAGLSKSVICTTINKVCASGMKSIMLGAQSIKVGSMDIVIAGGMESMSHVPRYLLRNVPTYGNVQLTDGILLDGLTDAYDKCHMGICAENTAAKLKITREEQDEYAKSSYERASEANKLGLLAKEIVPVELLGRKGEQNTIFEEDEEFKKVNLSKLMKLKPAFKENGTVTAGNASTLNDGAAASLLMSRSAIQRLNVKPLAQIIAFADAACDPIDFPLAPAYAIPKVSTLIDTVSKSMISFSFFSFVD